MKSLLFALSIACFSITGFAQPSATSEENETAAPAKIDSTNRLVKLETEVKELKATTLLLQQQIADLKKQFPVKKKKLVISRTSSKQGVWVDE